MKIALIGYGKMGKTIEQIAQQRGHEIVARFDVQGIDIQELTKADVAIEFSRPEAVVQNIKTCFEQKIPIVCGTTGWLEHFDEITSLCTMQQGGFFYASNYSIGVNLFFALNRHLAKLVQPYPMYNVELLEVHHTQKLDAPSGTAITLADDILHLLPQKTHWTNEVEKKSNELSILSERTPNVPGTHVVTYNSAIDSIEIKHTAHSREGFATGAVVAAEWLQGKKGVFGMEHLLGL
jgi:4-hydroxy-tetrahydrodipicolinate reductase